MMQSIFMELLWGLGIKAGLLVLLATLAVRLLGAHRPGLELAIWRSVLLAIVLLIPLGSLLPEWHLGVFLEQDSPEFLATVAQSQLPDPEMPAIQAPGAIVGVLGLLVYASGGLLALAGVLTSLWRLWRWSARAVPVRESHPCEVIKRLSAQMQFTGRVRALWSGRVSGPLSWGLWPPTILLPRCRYSVADVRLEHAIAHELAHLSRGDWAWHLLAQAVNVLCWWNPLVRLAVRRHGEQTEQACDRMAVRYCGSVQSYARTLLATAGGTNEIVAMSMAGKSGLGRRIESLINLDKRRLEMKPIHKLNCALAVIAIVLPLAACALTQAAEPDQQLAPVADRVATPSTPAPVSVAEHFYVPTVLDADVEPPIAPIAPDAVAPVVQPLPAPTPVERDLPIVPRSASAGSPLQPEVVPAAPVHVAPTNISMEAQVARSEADLARAQALEAVQRSRLEAFEIQKQARSTRLAASTAEQQARLASAQAAEREAVRFELVRAQQSGREQQRETNAALRLELAQVQLELASTRDELRGVQERLDQLQVESDKQ